uniref:Uncharacterized protein n=1 Tax=Avena sativa TaxID=4498 RepID=A0ACD5UGR1_AVESA
MKCTNHLKKKKLLLYLAPPILLVTIFFYFQLEILTLFFTIQRASTIGNGSDIVDRLRASTTFLPLKDTREGAETWFISTLNDTSEPEGEARNLRFPSAASSGRLLCMAVPSGHDGSKNSYALAWRDALPLDAELRTGLTFLSETFYDHSNLWHGLTALVPIVSWHVRRGCSSSGARPTRWAFFHHGEVRSGMSGWLMSLAAAATGVEVEVERFSGSVPVCFEEAVVFRRLLAGMSRERMLATFDFMRCKARAQCSVVVSRSGANGTDDPAAVPVRVTILFRRGGRSFRDEAAVERVFHKECARVAGCKLTTAQSGNLTFCDQVRLLSETDVLISAHGAQMTNLLFMDRNSSIMELYPMGWRQRAGGGQFVFRGMASWAGMRHEGSWWDPAGDPCPDGNPDILGCYKNRQIGMDEAYFSQFAAKVFNATKERKVGITSDASSKARGKVETCQCS